MQPRFQGFSCAVYHLQWLSEKSDEGPINYMKPTSKAVIKGHVKAISR